MCGGGSTRTRAASIKVCRLRPLDCRMKIATQRVRLSQAARQRNDPNHAGQGCPPHRLQTSPLRKDRSCARPARRKDDTGRQVSWLTGHCPVSAFPSLRSVACGEGLAAYSCGGSSGKGQARPVRIPFWPAFTGTPSCHGQQTTAQGRLSMRGMARGRRFRGVWLSVRRSENPPSNKFRKSAAPCARGAPRIRRRIARRAAALRR